jgi:hypothetical protein
MRPGALAILRVATSHSYVGMKCTVKCFVGCMKFDSTDSARFVELTEDIVHYVVWYECVGCTLFMVLIQLDIICQASYN